VLWFVAKVVIFVFCFFWLRASLPRIRYDQLMRLGWKVLIPGALTWTLVVATARVYRRQGGGPAVYIIGGAILVILLALLWRWESSGVRAERLAAQAAEERAEEEAEGPAAFPTPPLDLPHYHGIGLASSGGDAVLAGVTGEDGATGHGGGTKEVTGA
jgi:NADH-quinone oxidoreductase subunit H